MTLPASIKTISPGTSSNADTVSTCPLQRTTAVGAAIWRNAAIARSARYSWTVPITALRPTITRMTTVSITSPTTPEITAATIKTAIITSANWSMNILDNARRSPSGNWFLPTCWRRSACVASSNPRSGSERSKATASSTSSRCHF